MDNILKFLKRQQCFFFGSYIYKYQLRYEKPNDIDVAVPSGRMTEIITEMEKEFECRVVKTLVNDKMEYAHLFCNGIHFDLQDQNSVKKQLTSDRVKLFRLISMNHRYYYIDDNEQITDHEQTINEIIEDILNSKVDCSDLRSDKHRKYFNSWTCK